MIAASKEGGTSSDRKMEGSEGLRTLDCLRGRLLAERQASRVAKENAEFMGKKLKELENMLSEEIKLKNKAEKKLKFLKRKLESLKPSSVSVESEQSSSSENSEISRRQSTCTSSSNDPESHEAKVKDSEITEEFSQDQVAKSTTSEKSHESDPFTEENSTAQSTSTASSSSFSGLDFPSREGFFHKKSEDSKSGDHISYSTLKSSKEEIENENGKLDYVENALALVPVIMPATSHTSTTDLKPVSESVREVLDALRNIRENLQSSLEKRHMIGGIGLIGPSDQTQTCKYQ